MSALPVRGRRATYSSVCAGARVAACCAAHELSRACSAYCSSAGTLLSSLSAAKASESAAEADGASIGGACC